VTPAGNGAGPAGRKTSQRQPAPPRRPDEPPLPGNLPALHITMEEAIDWRPVLAGAACLILGLAVGAWLARR
jgi:hypothetical protein